MGPRRRRLLWLLEEEQAPHLAAVAGGGPVEQVAAMIDMFDLMTTASVAATFVRASSGASAPTSHPCSSSGNCLRSHLAAHPGQRPDGRRPPRQGHARPRPRRPADAQPARPGPERGRGPCRRPPGGRNLHRELPNALWRDPLTGTRAGGIADPRTWVVMLTPDINALPPYVNHAFLPQDPYQPAPTATDRRLAASGRTAWLQNAVHGEIGYFEATPCRRRPGAPRSRPPGTRASDRSGP